MVRSPEYNSFERPSFERMGGNFEGVKEPLPELRKSTPEQIQNTERVNRFANELYRSHMKIEIVSRDEMKQYFDTHLDTIWRTGEISFNQEKKVQEIREKPKEIITQTSPEKLSKLEKQSKNLNTLGEKENLTTYAELSDLAYVDFVEDSTKTTEGKQDSKELKVNTVQLDPLSFPSVRTLISGEKPRDMTENEVKLAEYIQDHPLEEYAMNLPVFDTTPVSRDASEILYIASSKKYDPLGIEMRIAMRNGGSPSKMEEGIQRGITTDQMSPKNSVQYASLDAKYRNTLIDTEKSVFKGDSLQKPPLTRDEKLQVLRLNAGLEHVRKLKTKESSDLFEGMKKKGFEVVDRFPDESVGDKGSSGFAAITFKDKQGKLYVGIRGTELTDFGDIGADLKLTVKSVPENQTRDLITFMERNIKRLPEGEKLRLSGHSLGGALSQLGSVMYDGQVEQTYTFNSPGAKKLSVNSSNYSGITREKFEKYAHFEYNEHDNSSVENRMINVAGSKGPSLIANLGNDIGFYKIDLPGLKSHSITELVKEVNKETTELNIVDVRKKHNNEIPTLKQEDIPK